VSGEDEDDEPRECMGYCSVDIPRKYYEMADIVGVTANALPGYKFLGWRGNGSIGEGEGEGEGEGPNLENEAYLINDQCIALHMTTTRNLDAHFGPDDPGDTDEKPAGTEACNGKFTQYTVDNIIHYAWKDEDFDTCNLPVDCPGHGASNDSWVAYCANSHDTIHSICHLNFYKPPVGNNWNWREVTLNCITGEKTQKCYSSPTTGFSETLQEEVPYHPMPDFCAEDATEWKAHRSEGNCPPLTCP
jgi:hypothetical protein